MEREGRGAAFPGRGEDVQGLVQRAMVTISTHHEQPGQAQGNKPGWMMVPLPLGEPDPVRRLELIAAETAARKHKARPEAGSGIFRFVAGQRVWYRRFPRQRSVNLVVTNVAGPPVPLYLAGARLLELFPMMPVMGNLTLVVGVLSYAGQLNLTAVADRDGCPDVEVFAQGVRTALEGAGAMEYTTIVAAPASDPAGFKWLAPYTGSAIGQHWMYAGNHVLIIFDDLSKQAEAYRAVFMLRAVEEYSVEETANIRGLPVVFTDTAGLREGGDEIELEGIRRSRTASVYDRATPESSPARAAAIQWPYQAHCAWPSANSSAKFCPNTELAGRASRRQWTPGGRSIVRFTAAYSRRTVGAVSSPAIDE